MLACDQQVDGHLWSILLVSSSEPFIRGFMRAW